jgi:hypothetical protein
MCRPPISPDVHACLQEVPVPIKTAALAAIAVAALAGTSYAATRGVQAHKGEFSVAPPTLFKASAAGARIMGTTGNDSMVGNTGNDRLAGGTGDDVLAGRAGNDILFGGIGHDVLRGGVGNDVIYARDGQWDVVDGGPGVDVAYVDKFDVVLNVERTRGASGANKTHRK